MNSDEYGICPYNNSHRILLFRMPAHIIKCRKNYCGPPLEQCIYNATHLVPLKELSQHEETCQDGHHFNKTQYEKLADNFKNF